MVADAFRLAGWDASFVQAGMSPIGVLSAVDEHRPDVVGLSAALPPHIPTVRATFEALRGEYGAHRPVFSVGGPMFQPEEIAAVVAFLASEDASFVTASVWPVDGGYTAQ